jgi:hypothetical protein
MPIRFDLAPFAGQAAFLVDQKGAALDTQHLYAVHVFGFNHVEQAAQAFVSIRDQFERQAELGFEVFVRLE